MSIYRRNYPDFAVCRVERTACAPPSIMPPEEMITQIKDNRTGKQVKLIKPKKLKSGSDSDSDDDKKKKKKRLPGEKLLKKLTNTKPTDDKVKRITNSIKRNLGEILDIA